MAECFGTIRNNTALKLCGCLSCPSGCFGTIRNNTALKLDCSRGITGHRFGTIRNNTALKHSIDNINNTLSFGTIRNNTALKHKFPMLVEFSSFGTIRNNTALKPRRKIFLTKFCNRAICPSQTSARQVPIVTLIIPYFQGSRNSLDPVHTGENHRLFEVRQIKHLVD